MIESTNRTTGPNGYQPILGRARNPVVKSSEAAVGETLSVHETRSLEEKVRNLPIVRDDIVALGRKLAADPNYPSEETLKKLANLLAETIDTTGE